MRYTRIVSYLFWLTVTFFYFAATLHVCRLFGALRDSA
jgi:hypothetical protein